MNLQNIECQLAQAQMNRYVAGDPLPDDTLQQLEKHLASCPECQAVATEKKVSLQLKLAQAASAEAIPAVSQPIPEVSEEAGEKPEPLDVVATPKTPERPLESGEPEIDTFEEPGSEAKVDPPTDAAPSPPAAWRSGLGFLSRFKISWPKRQPAAEASSTPPGRLNLKTLGLSVGLGLVLIVMSAFASDPTMLLGPKAEQATKKPDHPAATSEPEEKPTDKMDFPVKASVPETKRSVEPPSALKPKQPEEYAIARADGTVVDARGDTVVTVKRIPTKPAARMRRTPKPKPTTEVRRSPRTGTGTIRVYDENGRPMGAASGG